ncbi:MAG: response regulator transcription factor [Verrucomicrobiales bacterium]|nr:response regulator transcription factor [Verrucomicrobiales bacterium]
MNPEIKVAIIEDDPQVLANAAAIVEGTPGMKVTGRFDTAKEALESIPRLRPDVILCDLRLPDMTGDAVVTELRHRGVKSEVIVVTVHDDPDSVFTALKAGANGYLTKPVPPADLVAAIVQIYAKGAPMSAPIARRVLDVLRAPGSASVDSELNVLTPRELEVLELLSQGFRYKEIAAKLGVSVPTVTTHLHRTYEKLHVSGATAAVGKFLGGNKMPSS